MDLSKLPLYIQPRKGSKVWWLNTKTGKFIHKDNLYKYL